MYGSLVEEIKEKKIYKFSSCPMCFLCQHGEKKKGKCEDKMSAVSTWGHQKQVRFGKCWMQRKKKSIPFIFFPPFISQPLSLHWTLCRCKCNVCLERKNIHTHKTLKKFMISQFHNTYIHMYFFHVLSPLSYPFSFSSLSIIFFFQRKPLAHA